MINVFHIILHIFECFTILLCSAVSAILIKDYDALRGWVEFTFKVDLDKLAERIEEWKEEEGIT